MEEERKKIINKLNEIQSEILTIGWVGVLNKYHPENNIDNPNAANDFKLYKHVYENMKQRLKIDCNS